jgi:peptide/nickel transport system substrate-binding protein
VLPSQPQFCFRGAIDHAARSFGDAALRRPTTAAALLWFGMFAPAPAATPSDVIIEAVPAMPTSLAYDERGTGYENMEFNWNTKATLVRNPYKKNADGTYDQDVAHFEPYLAESWDVSPDGLVYTFHLRQGVKSVVGNELTADDVLWSYDRKWHVPVSTPFVNAPIIRDPAKQFTKIDTYTFSISLARNSDGFTLLGLLANVSAHIYDSTLLKQHATAEDKYAVAWSGQDGNFSWGTYMVKSFKPGQELVLVTNPNTLFGEPKIRRIVQRVVPDAGTRVNLLKNGDVDIASQLRPADVAELSTDKSVKVFNNVTNNWIITTMRTNTKPFDDLVVRQAFALAIPYREIIDQVYKGRADPIRGFINKNYPNDVEQGLAERVYDPEKAKQMLTAAGYTKPIPFGMLISSAVPDLQEVNIQIQTYAAKAGFDMKIDLVPPTALFQLLSAGNFQATMYRDMAITLSPSYELLLTTARGSILNRSKWENDAFYAAVDAGLDAGDPMSPEAGRHWADAQRIWQHDTPFIALMTVRPLIGFNRRVGGFAWKTDNIVDFNLITKN